MMLPVAIGYLDRIRIEEKWLSEQLGKDYWIYRERTKKIIPLLYYSVRVSQPYRMA